MVTVIAGRLRQLVLRRRRTFAALVVCGLFALAGLLALRLGGAATFAVSAEAELGAISGNAGAVDSAGASGERAVKFGTATGGGYRPGFVYRQGRNFMLDGQVWRFVGTNNTGLTGCHTGWPADQAEAEGFFSNLRPKSLTRVWAFSNWEEGIDTVVKAAEKYDQKIVFALADGAEFCDSPDYEAAWYQSGYQGAYFSWITEIAARYKDSPAVAIWEIMNEPGNNVMTNLAPAVMKSFFDNTAAHIKASDPNHLVATGSLAPWQSFMEGAAGYASAHSGPNIDAMSLHEYDYAYNNTRFIESPWWDDVRNASIQTNKPAYVGETGVSLATGCLTATQRADVLRQKFDAYLNRDASGILYWAVLTDPNNEGPVCDYPYGNNDPYDGAVMTMIRNYQMPN